MANPNTALRYIVKRPFAWDSRHNNEFAAEDRVAELKAAGWDAKITRVGAKRNRATGSFSKPFVNVWKRERNE